MDFWNLLWGPNQDDQEDLTKLNEYGTNINKLIQKVDYFFDKLKKVKNNDKETIQIYYDYLSNILNDTEKSKFYKNMLKDIELAKQNYDDMNLINGDMNALSSSDEYQYIRLSAQPHKLGIIENISLGVCNVLGYSRDELVGKDVEIIQPDIFHLHHKKLLRKKISKVNQFKLDEEEKFNMTGKCRKYKPEFKDLYTFGKTKSRYLMPLFLSISYIPNAEEEESFFVSKVSYSDFINKQNRQLYIIVGKNFLIQNFTANCMPILELNINSINNPIFDIFKFIKEFSDSLHMYKEERENLTLEEIYEFKRNLLKKNMEKTSTVTFRVVERGKNNETGKFNYDLIYFFYFKNFYLILFIWKLLIILIYYLFQINLIAI